MEVVQGLRSCFDLLVRGSKLLLEVVKLLFINDVTALRGVPELHVDLTLSRSAHRVRPADGGGVGDLSRARVVLEPLVGCLALLLLSAKLIDSSLFRSEEHTSELQSQSNLVCRLLLE